MGFGLQGLGGGSSSEGFSFDFNFSSIWEFIKNAGWYNCLIGVGFLIGGIMFLYNL